MSEENKAVMRRFYEEFVNAGNLAVAGETSPPIASYTSAACSWAPAPKPSSKPAS